MSPWVDLKGQRLHSDQRAPSRGVGCVVGGGDMLQGQFPPPRFQSQPSRILHRTLPYPETTWRGYTFVKSHRAEATDYPFCILLSPLGKTSSSEYMRWGIDTASLKGGVEEFTQPQISTSLVSKIQKWKVQALTNRCVTSDLQRRGVRMLCLREEAGETKDRHNVTRAPGGPQCWQVWQPMGWRAF